MQHKFRDPFCPFHIWKVTRLNDGFRTSLSGGTIDIAPELDALPPHSIATIMEILTGRQPGRDWYINHDHSHGHFHFGTLLICWTISCHERGVGGPANDPTNAKTTLRTLWVGVGEEASF